MADRNIPNPGPGSSLTEVLRWTAAVRERNRKMEGLRGDLEFSAKLAESDAEDLYGEMKARLAKMSGEASQRFWLKFLWYAAWGVPFSALDAVHKVWVSRKLPGGWEIAHIPRPEWIKPPVGGDDFDNGIRAERLRPPL